MWWGSKAFLGERMSGQGLADSGVTMIQWSAAFLEILQLQMWPRHWLLVCLAPEALTACCSCTSLHHVLPSRLLIYCKPILRILKLLLAYFQLKTTTIKINICKVELPHAIYIWIKIITLLRQLHIRCSVTVFRGNLLQCKHMSDNVLGVLFVWYYL